MKKEIFYLALLLLSCSQLVYGQNARVSVSNELLKSINSNNASTLNDFIERNVNYNGDDDLKNRWVKMFQTIRSNYGRLSYLKSRINQPDQLEIFCRTGKNNAYLHWMRIRLSFNPAAPEKFTRASAGWVADPAVEVPSGLLSPEQIAKYSKEFVDHMTKENRFSGAVLLAKAGQIIYEDAKGYAVKSKGLKINLDTKLNLASATKMFTGVAIAQLVQRGKLTYQTTLKEVLPFFEKRGKKSDITIHQLLTHSSGLGDFWAVYDRSDRSKILSLSDYFDLVRHDALLFDPGNGKQYSNVGLIVLGLVIEELTGENYIEYANENIFKPARMNDTGFYSLYSLPSNIAEGYYFKNRGSRNRISNHDHKPIHGSAQGGAYSTIYDMLKFEKALFSYQLIDEKYVDTITTPKIELYPNFQYGYAFQCPTLNGHTYIGHDGGSPGISAEIRMFRDDGYTIIVLSNYSSAADELAEFITNMIIRN